MPYVNKLPILRLQLGIDMKVMQKKEAIELRLQGKSIKDISRELGVAKSSVSVWVRNVELNDYQISNLKNKGLSRDKIERTRLTRLANERAKRELLINAACLEVPIPNKGDLWLTGIML